MYITPDAFFLLHKEVKKEVQFGDPQMIDSTTQKQAFLSINPWRNKNKYCSRWYRSCKNTIQQSLSRTIWNLENTEIPIVEICRLTSTIYMKRQ